VETKELIEKLRSIIGDIAISTERWRIVSVAADTLEKLQAHVAKVEACANEQTALIAYWSNATVTATMRAEKAQTRVIELEAAFEREVDQRKKAEDAVELLEKKLAQGGTIVPGGVTVVWEPDSNRVVVTYNNVPRLDVVTRRS
jgi:hypothetical protein